MLESECQTLFLDFSCFLCLKNLVLIRLFWKYKKDSGTKSLPRLYYSSGWFVGSTHRQQIEHYMNEQRAIAKSFSQKTIPVEAADLQVTPPVDSE